MIDFQTKNTPFFGQLFALIIQKEWLGKFFQFLDLEVLDHARLIKNDTQQSKVLVDQNGDIIEWKRRGFFVITF